MHRQSSCGKQRFRSLAVSSIGLSTSLICLLPGCCASAPPHIQERAFKAAAHNPRNSAEERRHAAQEYARIHQQRTGVAVDAEEEFQVGEKLAQRRHPVAEPAGIFTPD